MNFRLTITLVVILLLSVSIWIFTTSPARTDKKDDPNASALINPQPSNLVAISYSLKGVDQLKFVKQGDDWKMTFPSAADADDTQLKSMATLLQTLKYSTKFAPEATGNRSAEATGTKDPNDVIKFTDDNKREYTIAFGKHTPDSIYATLNGDKTVYKLDTNPLDRFTHDSDAYRNMEVKTIDTNKVVGITMKSKDENWAATKSAEKWLISAPIPARANAGTVSEILKETQTIRAQGFVTYTKKETGLEPPLSSVTILVQEASAPANASSMPATQPAPTSVTIQFGFATDITVDKKNSAVYASIDGSNEVFILPNNAFKKLNRPFKEMRDPAVTAAQVTSATDLILTTDGAATLALAKKDNKWSITNTSPLIADTFNVNDYLDAIHGLRAITFADNTPDLKTIGLDPPHMKIELTVPGQVAKEIILVGKTETDPKGGKITPMMLQGEPTVFQVQSADADKLVTSPLALRDRTIEQLISDRIRTIAIAGPSATSGLIPPPATSTAPATAPATGPTTATAATAPAPQTPGVVLERTGIRWLVNSNGQTPVADDSKISAILSEFTPIAATKYVSDKIESSGTPAITVTISLLEPTILPSPPEPSKVEPVVTPVATGPATSTAPATATRPAPTLAEVVPNQGFTGPDPGKVVTRVLQLYKSEADGKTTWKAVWADQNPPPAWTFEPSGSLMEMLTKGIFVPTPTPPPPPAAPPGFPGGMGGMEGMPGGGF